jgi:cell division protein FtsQ
VSGRVGALRRGLRAPWRAGLVRPLSGLRASGARLARSVSIPPHQRRRLALAAVVAVLLGAFYMLWLRDCPLVRVDQTTVTGASGQDAGQINRALQAAAGDMTTLHVRHDELMRSVRHFPVVADVRTSAHFPDKLSITVIERRPAAVVVAPGRRVAVAGDGILLTGIDAHGDLPVIRSGRELSGRRLAEGGALAAAGVLGGAPAYLSPRLTAIRHSGGRGWVVKMRGGPDLFFGSATRLRAKWMAATRVLADKASAGASYVDVRLPERPAAGGLDTATKEETDPNPLDQTPSGTGAQDGPSSPQQSAPATPATPQQQAPAAPAPGVSAPTPANPQP